MSIATQIQRLQTAKADIKTAIENKGVTIPSNATIDAYPTYVSQISGGDDGYKEVFKKLIQQESYMTLDIPEGVTKIGDFAFYTAVTLTAVTIPNGVRKIGSSAFEQCTSLRSINIPEGVTTINQYAFERTALTSIIIPSTITTISIGAFYSTSLESVTILATTPPSMASGAFNKLNTLPTFYVPAESVELYKSATNWNAYADYIKPISE